MDMKRFFLYAIAIAVLALAGCGGNSKMMTGGGSGGTACPKGQMGTPPECVTPPPPTCADDPMAAHCTGPTSAELTKAAETKLAQIRMEATQTTDAGLGGSATDGSAVDTYSLTIERDSMETKVMIADTALANDDDPKFMKAMDLPDGNKNGFPGSMHVREMKADDDGNVKSEVVIVRTDIDAPTPRPFVMDGNNKGVYSLNANNDGSGDPQSLTVVEGDDDVNLPLIMSASFSSASAGGSDATHAFLPAKDDDTSTADVDESRDAAKVMGSYDGGMGHYICSTGDGGANCTVKVNAKGVVTGISAGWIFTPAAGAMVDVDDTSYLAYGFWLDRTSKDGKVTSYDEVETFAMVVGMEETTEGSGVDEIGSVMGSATYKGGAAGVYVNANDGGTIDKATSGHFQADITLNAKFGGGNIGVNNQFAIDGSITNFALSGKEENDWKVELMPADFSGRAGMGPGKEAAGTSHENAFKGDAKGDALAATGSWNGVFYGAAGSEIDHDNDTSTDGINQAPAAVVGEFNAYFTDGGVAGAYGANKE